MPIKPCRKCGAPIHFKVGVVGNAAPMICDACKRGAKITEELLKEDEDEDREDES